MKEYLGVKKRIVLSVALILVLLSSFGTVMSSQVNAAGSQDDHGQDDKPKTHDFTATFDIKQLVANNIPVGKGVGKYRTNFEIFQGSTPVASNWTAINGSEIWMTAVTNYTVDILGNLKGTTHVTMIMIQEGLPQDPTDNSSLMFDANGTITGNVYLGPGTIVMKFNSGVGSGNLVSAKADGSILAAFNFHSGLGSATITGKYQ